MDSYHETCTSLYKGTGLSCSALNYSNAVSQGKILTREVKKRNQKTNKHIPRKRKRPKKDGKKGNICARWLRYLPCFIFKLKPSTVVNSLISGLIQLQAQSHRYIHRLCGIRLSRFAPELPLRIAATGIQLPMIGKDQSVFLAKGNCTFFWPHCGQKVLGQTAAISCGQG